MPDEKYLNMAMPHALKTVSPNIGRNIQARENEMIRFRQYPHKYGRFNMIWLIGMTVLISDFHMIISRVEIGDNRFMDDKFMYSKCIQGASGHGITGKR